MSCSALPKIAFSAIEAHARERNPPADKVAGRRAVPGAAETSFKPHASSWALPPTYIRGRWGEQRLSDSHYLI
jgi:hypothetical protein